MASRYTRVYPGKRRRQRKSASPPRYFGAISVNVVVVLTYFRAALKKKKKRGVRRGRKSRKVLLSFRAGRLFRSRFFRRLCADNNHNRQRWLSRASPDYNSIRPAGFVYIYPAIYTHASAGDSGRDCWKKKKIPASFSGKRRK